MAISPTLYYDVLGLPPPPHSIALAPEVIRKAYHAALLRHHPDKNISDDAVLTLYSSEMVDCIVKAYNILSSPDLRAEYDKVIMQKRKLLNDESEYTSRIIAQADLVDLDDFDSAEMCLKHRIPENESICETCEREEVWYKECRCGDVYLITESMLVEVSSHFKGEDGEVLVQCPRCSTWLRVLFAIS
ncbi:uncharacterized protein V2V93DRAFT_369867 [Kockiozyma suomiensis]|uniref:uncharacterized protein n=1 Tax=Kockiozyma suomiensis TaxID=1337062 RepID=UPI0033439BE8